MSEHFSSNLTNSDALALESVRVGRPALASCVPPAFGGNSNSDILAEIAQHKIGEINASISAGASPQILSGVLPPLPFADALANAEKSGRFPIIAEMKRECPSAGKLRNGNYKPVDHAQQYAEAGAACLSVLTDKKYFGGENKHLRDARARVDLPILRKDFIVHENQIVESRALGADAVLLIAALGKVLGQDFDMEKWAAKAQQLGMTVIVEIRNDEELERALGIPDALIGINNRDLRTFEVSLDTTVKLARKAKDEGRFVISESGIDSAESVSNLRKHGADAFLVGTALMRSPNPGAALRALFE